MGYLFIQPFHSTFKLEEVSCMALTLTIPAVQDSAGLTWGAMTWNLPCPSDSKEKLKLKHVLVHILPLGQEIPCDEHCFYNKAINSLLP